MFIQSSLKLRINLWLVFRGRVVANVLGAALAALFGAKVLSDQGLEPLADEVGAGDFGDEGVNLANRELVRFLELAADDRYDHGWEQVVRVGMAGLVVHAELLLRPTQRLWPDTV